MLWSGRNPSQDGMVWGHFREFLTLDGICLSFWLSNKMEYALAGCVGQFMVLVGVSCFVCRSKSPGMVPWKPSTHDAWLRPTHDAWLRLSNVTGHASASHVSSQFWLGVSCCCLGQLSPPEKPSTHAMWLRLTFPWASGGYPFQLSPASAELGLSPGAFFFFFFFF